jgi:hypothetical protein
MSPRTPTHPPNDPGMWRRLVARAHPDSGGDNNLFIWAMATREAVCGGDLGAEIPRREAATSGADRIPFEEFANFEALTDRAATRAASGPPRPRAISSLVPFGPAASLIHELLRVMHPRGWLLTASASGGRGVGPPFLDELPQIQCTKPCHLS